MPQGPSRRSLLTAGGLGAAGVLGGLTAPNLLTASAAAPADALTFASPS